MTITNTDVYPYSGKHFRL